MLAQKSWTLQGLQYISSMSFTWREWLSLTEAKVLAIYESKKPASHVSEEIRHDWPLASPRPCEPLTRTNGRLAPASNKASNYPS